MLGDVIFAGRNGAALADLIVMENSSTLWDNCVLWVLSLNVFSSVMTFMLP